MLGDVHYFFIPIHRYLQVTLPNAFKRKQSVEVLQVTFIRMILPESFPLLSACHCRKRKQKLTVVRLHAIEGPMPPTVVFALNISNK